MTQGLLNSGLYDPQIQRPHPANYANDVYWANDRDEVAVSYYNDQAIIYRAGIDAPTAFTPTLDTSAGAAFIPSTYPYTYYLRYRYVNKNKRGPGGDNFYVSDPSPSGTIRVLDSNDAAQFGVTASVDPKVTDIALEYSADGANWLFLQYVANSTATITHKLNIYTSGVFLPWNDFGHERPPAGGRVLITHKNRLFKTHLTVEASGTVTTTGTGDTNPVLTLANSLHKWGPPMSGRFFKAADEVNSAIIATVDSTTGVTLASGYGATLTGAAYTITPDDPNVVYFSKVLLPESWNYANNSFRVLVNTNDTPLAMASYFDDILFFGSRSIEALKYLDSPGGDGTFFMVDDTRGAVNQECVIKVDSAIYAMDRAGLYRYTGSRPEQISGPIDEILEGRANGWKGINWNDAANTFFAVHNPDLRRISWFCTLDRTGETTDMTKAITYNYDENTWVIYDFLNTMRAGSTVVDQNGQVRPLLASKEGGVWLMRDNTTDGLPSAVTVVSGIVAPGATTTVIPTSGEILHTLNQGLKHCAAILEGTGSGTIASNTSSQFTLNEALGSAPSAGDTFLIAPIQMKILTRAVAVRSPSDKSVLTYLEMLHEPTTAGGAQEISVKVKLDYSSTYANFAEEAKTLLPGVRVDSGALDTAVVSLKADGYNKAGYIRIPMPSVAFHVAEIEIYTEGPRNKFSLNGIMIRGQAGEISEI